MRRSLVLPALLLVGAAPLSAQQPSPPCGAPEYRQFDFWVGAWTVFNPAGQQVGTNTIDRTLKGCALHEQWTSAAGTRGFSYNTYDRSSGRWHQTWVDESGTLLLIDGGLDDGKMVLSGTTKGPQGPVLNRITWSPVAPDSVRQLWETSADEGKTWSVAFDGMYVRVKGGGEQE